MWKLEQDIHSPGARREFSNVVYSASTFSVRILKFGNEKVKSGAQKCDLWTENDVTIKIMCSLYSWQPIKVDSKQQAHFQRTILCSLWNKICCWIYLLFLYKRRNILFCPIWLYRISFCTVDGVVIETAKSSVVKIKSGQSLRKNNQIEKPLVQKTFIPRSWC